MKRWILSLCFLTQAHAAPGTLEVWILSNTKVSDLQTIIDRPSFVTYPKTAELQCQEMGEYCFDPQVGLYKRDDMNAEVQSAKVVDPVAGMAHGRSLDRDLIDCDKGNYFDIFCGKAKPVEAKSKTKIEVWVDTSSSMREFDFQEKDGSCHRKRLLEKLDKTCDFNTEVNVMMFDTSIKQAGTIDSLCQSQGLNDYKRLMDWIERSDAKHLIVITDIYELHKDFADYVSSKQGIIRGDKDALTAAAMLKHADHLAKSCR